MQLRSKHPEWALKYKTSGTELRFIKGRYYLYVASSKWNSDKKRAQKITGKILGRITEDQGFIPSGNKNTPILQLKELSVKTFGIVNLLEPLMKDVLSALKKHFGKDGESLYCASIMRLIHQSTLKNMELHFSQDFLSESFKNVSLSDKKMTGFLET